MFILDIDVSEMTHAEIAFKFCINNNLQSQRVIKELEDILEEVYQEGTAYGNYLGSAGSNL